MNLNDEIKQGNSLPGARWITEGDYQASRRVGDATVQTILSVDGKRWAVVSTSGEGDAMKTRLGFAANPKDAAKLADEFA